MNEFEQEIIRQLAEINKRLNAIDEKLGRQPNTVYIQAKEPETSMERILRNFFNTGRA